MNIPEEYINQIEMKLGHPVIDLKLDRHNIINTIEEEFNGITGNLRSRMNSEHIEHLLNDNSFKDIVVGVLMQQNNLNIIYSLMYQTDIANAQITMNAAIFLIKYGKHLESKGRKNCQM